MFAYLPHKSLNPRTKCLLTARDSDPVDHSLQSLSSIWLTTFTTCLTSEVP